MRSGHFRTLTVGGGVILNCSFVVWGKFPIAYFTSELSCLWILWPSSARGIICVPCHAINVIKPSPKNFLSSFFWWCKTTWHKTELEGLKTDSNPTVSGKCWFQIEAYILLSCQSRGILCYIMSCDIMGFIWHPPLPFSKGSMISS